MAKFVFELKETSAVYYTVEADDKIDAGRLFDLWVNSHTEDVNYDLDKHGSCEWASEMVSTIAEDALYQPVADITWDDVKEESKGGD